MFDLFLEGNKYYDYPSFEVAIYSLLLALVLSTILAYTYRLTYDGEHFSKSLFQGMVLSSLVTSMIMMAVGNNLAVGFGIIGAVAIIRFRTNIQSPRNIIFMFAALAVGITTGVYGYAVSVAGTITFTITAFLLNISNFRVTAVDVYEVECATEYPEAIDSFKPNLEKICSKIELGDARQRFERLDKYTFKVKLKKGIEIEDAFRALRQEGIQELRINRVTSVEQL